MHDQLPSLPSLLPLVCSTTGKCHHLVALGVPIVDKVALVRGSTSLAAGEVVAAALGPLSGSAGAGRGGHSRGGAGGGDGSTGGRSSKGGGGSGRLDGGGTAAAAARGARVGGGGAWDRSVSESKEEMEGRIGDIPGPETEVVMLPLSM